MTFGTVPVSSLREAGEECCCHYCDKVNGVLLVTSVVPQVHPIAAASVIEHLCRLLSARSVGCALPGYTVAYHELLHITWAQLQSACRV